MTPVQLPIDFQTALGKSEEIAQSKRPSVDSDQSVAEIVYHSILSMCILGCHHQKWLLLPICSMPILESTKNIVDTHSLDQLMSALQIVGCLEQLEVAYG